MCVRKGAVMRSTGEASHGTWRKAWRREGCVPLGRRAAGGRSRRSWSVRLVCRLTWSWSSRPLPGAVCASGGAACGRSDRRFPGKPRIGPYEGPCLSPGAETRGSGARGGEVPGERLGGPPSHLPTAWTVLCGMLLAALIETTAIRAGGPSGAPQLAGAAAPSARCSTTTRQTRPSECATVIAQAAEAPVKDALPGVRLSADLGSGHTVSVRTTSSASARSSPIS